MCFGGSNRAANEARASREQTERQRVQREADIRTGQQAIETAFAPYSDPNGAFFRDFERSIVDFARPQVERQFRDASGTMATGLARRGMLESTFGANETARLGGDFADEMARIRNDAVNQSRGLFADVNQQKGDLLSLNVASADPQTTSALANASARSIVAPAPTTTIGQVFSGAVQPYVAMQTAAQNSPAARPRSTAPVASGAGSSRIVR